MVQIFNFVTMMIISREFNDHLYHNHGIIPQSMDDCQIYFFIYFNLQVFSYFQDFWIFFENSIFHPFFKFFHFFKFFPFFAFLSKFKNILFLLLIGFVEVIKNVV